MNEIVYVYGKEAVGETRCERNKNDKEDGIQDEQKDARRRTATWNTTWNKDSRGKKRLGPQNVDSCDPRLRPRREIMFISAAARNNPTVIPTATRISPAAESTAVENEFDCEVAESEAKRRRPPLARPARGADGSTFVLGEPGVEARTRRQLDEDTDDHDDERALARRLAPEVARHANDE